MCYPLRVTKCTQLLVQVLNVSHSLPTNLPCSNQRLVIIEPLIDMSIFLLIQLHLHWLKRLHVQHIISVVKGRLLIVKRREPHPLKVTSITLFSTQHDPHCPGNGTMKSHAISSSLIAGTKIRLLNFWLIFIQNQTHHAPKASAVPHPH